MMHVLILLLLSALPCNCVRPTIQDNDGASVTASGHFQLHKQKQGLSGTTALHAEKSQNSSSGGGFNPFAQQAIDSNKESGANGAGVLEDVEPVQLNTSLDSGSTDLTESRDTIPDMSEFEDTEASGRGTALETDSLQQPTIDATEVQDDREVEVPTTQLDVPIRQLDVPPTQTSDVTDVSAQEELDTETPKPVETPKPDGLAPNIEDSVESITPGEELRMFRQADGKVGEMEEHAQKMQNHLAGVNAAWEKVDGKLSTYHESIEDLGRQFNELTESAHGIHDNVKTEFRDKEKFRMCSFENAKRVLKGEPEVDCSTI